MSRMITLLLLAMSSMAPAQDWPSWRGPNGDGTTPCPTAPMTFGADANVKWKVPLARPANGSPIVVKGKIFLTMPEDAEGKKRSLYCYDRTNGKQLWVRTVDFGVVMPTHKTNPYGGSTPASDGKHVLVWHGSAGLYCYDLDGKELWKRDLGEFRHMWGYGTSPILHEGRVILNTGPGVQSFVAAFDLATGKTLWKTDEPEFRTKEDLEKKRIAGSWCTPSIVKVDQKDQIICAHPTRVVAYDPKDGTILWTCAGVSGTRGDLIYSSPLVADDACYFVGGWEGPSFAVRVGGKGDVTETHRLWREEKTMSNCSTGLYAKGRVYVVDMGGMLYAVDPKTGVADWKTRIGRGSAWGSIVAVKDHLYLMNQKGTIVVFKPGQEGPEILATNELGETTNSTPAISDGELFLRTHESLWCIADKS